MNENHGTAGASAFHEYERRRAKDQAAVEAEHQRVRDRFGGGRLGGAIAAISVDRCERSSTKVWEQGAIGEVKVGMMLDELAEAGVIVLHDRRIPGSRANIDHLVITSAGVWVIDTKRYVGKRPARYVDGGLLGFGSTVGLKIGGRRRDELVEGVLAQMVRVQEPLDSQVPVRGVLCFVDADWPLFGGDFSIRDVRVVWPKLLRKQLLASPAVIPDAVGVGQQLAEVFRPAR